MDRNEFQKNDLLGKEWTEQKKIPGRDLPRLGMTSDAPTIWRLGPPPLIKKKMQCIILAHVPKFAEEKFLLSAVQCGATASVKSGFR
ncbi:hypothetical protein [Rhizobium hidalgonense]|uniref:hypothetical protein n=1 Tax=Rhizobium hidalgonense TaxID=1538159 RepID=UPI002871972A|nr:hypothetical protein [Rhizobium hidalgonense]MDR9809792.1 hypothetical protein [Rhizobium hidalgonense]